MGRRSGTEPATQYTLEFVAGGSVVASTVGQPDWTRGTWQDITCQYTPAAGAAAVGQAITVRLRHRGASNAYTDFDNIRVHDTGVRRIVPLGDSLTDGHNIAGGYRPDLLAQLRIAAMLIDFAGTQNNGAMTDRNHEGHSGYRIDEIAAGFDTWAAAYPQTPTDVLLMLGTNDCIQNHDLTNAPDRLDALIDQVLAALPGAHVWVASIPRMADATRNQRVNAFNSAIPAIVSTKIGEGKAVSFVDINAAVTASDLIADGVHLNASGNAAVAGAFANAIIPEPATLSLVGIGAIAALQRRNRRRR